jgi:hypothetical protein
MHAAVQETPNSRVLWKTKEQTANLANKMDQERMCGYVFPTSTTIKAF